MKFNANGPDIPLELIKALDEDKLVFFCGAGVSALKNRPAFSSFPKLLKEVTRQLNFTDTSIFEIDNIEDAFERLELEFDRKTIEDSIRRILTIDRSSSEQLKQHETVLRLSRTINRPNPRSVTTNFDNCFDCAWQSFDLPDSLISHSANAVPVPDTDWSSVVYLHGKADIPYSELVYSRTGFAKAYIGSRWAPRFLMDLFQEYVVVFLGYSMQDPIMRYGVSALRPDRKPYIFIQDGERAGIGGLRLQVIPYNDHEGLWSSLGRWADLHEQGRDGWISYAKAELINNYPSGQEMAPQSIEAVKNLTEILSDAHRARGLIDNLPVEWLSTFKRIDKESELKAEYFNVLQPGGESISVNPYGRISNTFLDSRPLHPVTCSIADWMTKNIADKDVLEYIVDSGGILNPNIAYHFKHAVKGSMENPLSRIQQCAWELLLFHSSPPQALLEYVGSKNAVPKDGFLLQSFMQVLLKQLQPRLKIKKPYFSHPDSESLAAFLDIEIKISGSLEGKIKDLSPAGFLHQLQNEHPQVLPAIFSTLETHLHEVIRLSALFQEESQLNRRQNWESKSESADSDSWTIILDWLWGAFDSLDPEKQGNTISRWSKSSSLLFKRMALKGYNQIQGRGLKHDP